MVVARAKYGTFKMWKNCVIGYIGFVGNSPCFCSLCQGVYCRLFCHNGVQKKTRKSKYLKANGKET